MWHLHSLLVNINILAIQTPGAKYFNIIMKTQINNNINNVQALISFILPV